MPLFHDVLITFFDTPAKLFCVFLNLKSLVDSLLTIELQRMKQNSLETKFWDDVAADATLIRFVPPRVVHYVNMISRVHIGDQK